MVRVKLHRHKAVSYCLTNVAILRLEYEKERDGEDDDMRERMERVLKRPLW